MDLDAYVITLGIKCHIKHCVPDFIYSPEECEKVGEVDEEIYYSGDKAESLYDYFGCNNSDEENVDYECIFN